MESLSHIELDSWLIFIIISLATFRITRVLTTDVIFESLRDKIWKKYPPHTSIGYLFTCNWCMSVWVASLLVICYTIIPALTLIASSIFALSAVAGLISSKLDD
jgi:hypothetical protein